MTSFAWVSPSATDSTFRNKHCVFAHLTARDIDLDLIEMEHEECHLFDVAQARRPQRITQATAFSQVGAPAVEFHRAGGHFRFDRS